jgi:hypothetical protein
VLMQILGAAVRRMRPAVAPAFLGAAGLLAIGVVPAVAQNDEVFKPTTAISLPNGQKVTSFDIGIVNSGAGLYYLADRTNNAIDVVETTTNTVFQIGVGKFAGLGATPDTSGPNGVINVGPDRLWIGDFPSVVRVFDPYTNKKIKTIHTGGKLRADELCFDPADKLVMVANDADDPPFVSLISTVDFSIVAKIVMDGTNGTPKATNGIEQCQWSKVTNKFYVAIPEVNGPGDDSAPGAVLMISPAKKKIVKTFNLPLEVCAGPQGMAIGFENQILLGCNDPKKTSPSAVIINARSGEVIHVLANEDGADEVDFNPSDGHFFLARSGGASPTQQLGVVDSPSGSLDTSPVTGNKPGGGAHSVAADPLTKHVFVPIPSTAGGTVCSSAGGSDSLGCIAVFSTSNDDQVFPNDLDDNDQ